MFFLCDFQHRVKVPRDLARALRERRRGDRLVGQHLEDLDRLGDVLERLFAQVFEREGDLARLRSGLPLNHLKPRGRFLVL